MQVIYFEDLGGYYLNICANIWTDSKEPNSLPFMATQYIDLSTTYPGTDLYSFYQDLQWEHISCDTFINKSDHQPFFSSMY